MWYFPTNYYGKRRETLEFRTVFVDVRWSFIFPARAQDGHFVPNLTLGAPIIKSLRKHTTAFLDCHLMVSEPGKWVDDFAKAGASQYTFHIEATGAQRVIRCLQRCLVCCVGGCECRCCCDGYVLKALAVFGLLGARC